MNRLDADQICPRVEFAPPLETIVLSLYSPPRRNGCYRQLAIRTTSKAFFLYSSVLWIAVSYTDRLGAHSAELIAARVPKRRKFSLFSLIRLCYSVKETSAPGRLCFRVSVAMVKNAKNP